MKATSIIHHLTLEVQMNAARPLSHQLRRAERLRSIAVRMFTRECYVRGGNGYERGRRAILRALACESRASSRLHGASIAGGIR